MFFSKEALKGSIRDWTEITPAGLQKAVKALRERFDRATWKIGQIMGQGCYAALHKGAGEEAREMSRIMERGAWQPLPTVERGLTEPAIFVAWFDRSCQLLAKEVRGIFSDLLRIAFAQSHQLDCDPVEWAELQMKVMIADESYRISIWTKEACDRQHSKPDDSEEDRWGWKSWRAPAWFCAQPFASWPYSSETAWNRMDEGNTHELLREVVERFNGHLVFELERAVGEANVRQAQTVDTGITVPIASPEVQLPSTSKTIGQNIDALRKECGWSLDELAAQTGIDKKSILSHVNKGAKPHPRTLAEYAQAFTRKLGRKITAADLEK